MCELTSDHFAAGFVTGFVSACFATTLSLNFAYIGALGDTMIPSVIGETIGNFRLVGRLGRGGMGEVFAAEHTSIETKAAIKLLHADISSQHEHVQRFFNEARIVGKIKHAGIVKIFDVGFHKGQAYLVMELLEGESLQKRLASAKRLPTSQIVDYVRQLASVLDSTHRAGVIHRDLKPDNIFLVHDEDLGVRERIKVLDFGIAKLTGTLLDTSSPKTQGTMGTPAYMAPEQWGNSANVTWAADAYSLGCVAFQMACGRPPFLSTSVAEACAQHLSEQPPRASKIANEVPAALDDLIAKLLSKDPAARGASMAAIAAALDASFPRMATPLPGPNPLLAMPDAAKKLGSDATLQLDSLAPAPLPVRQIGLDTTLSSSVVARSIPQPNRRSGKLLLVLGSAVVLGGATIAVLEMRGHDGNRVAHVAPPPQPTPQPIPPPAATAPPPVEKPEVVPDPHVIATPSMKDVLGRVASWTRTHAGAPCPDAAALGASADPWGHAFTVTCTDQPGDQIMGLVSNGPDGAAGTADDITSWQLDDTVTGIVHGARWTSKHAPVAAHSHTKKQAVQLDENGLPISR